MNKKLHNILFLSGSFSFLVSLFVIFEFKKEIMQDRAQLSSRILQSLVNAKYSALKSQVLELAQKEDKLLEKGQAAQSVLLSDTSIDLLAILNIKKPKAFSWFVANSSEFAKSKVAKRVLQKIRKNLSLSIRKQHSKLSTVFPLQVSGQQHFVLALPYGHSTSGLWVVAVLPKLSFISWLPLQQVTNPFSLLSASADVISHANHFYVAKKTVEPWSIEQNQLGVLEADRFSYANFDFTFQVFSKIEGSSLFLNSSWKMYFWPMFVQLLIVFFCIFFLIPYLGFLLFSKKEKPSSSKEFFTSKKETVAVATKAKEESLLSPELESTLPDEQEDLVSLQELPAHSSIIKDLKSLIDDLDTKPLSPVDLPEPSSSQKKEQGL